VLETVLWLLAAASLWTIAQRMRVVHAQATVEQR
jgi:hypothetical protein